MPGAPSLCSSATKICIKNIQNISSVGDLEYMIVKDILRHVKSARQLKEIEDNSPQIAGDDAALWQALIAKDIPDWATKNYVPKDPRKWAKVYAKYKKEQEEKIQRDKDILVEQLSGIKAKKDSMLLKVIPRSQAPKLPRDSRLVANGGILLKRSTGWGPRQDGSSLAFTGGSKTKTTDGKSVMARVRREAAETAARNRLAKPAHNQLGRVQQAPAGMVDAYKRKTLPAVSKRSEAPSRSIRIPGRPYERGRGSTGPSLEDREARLMAMQKQKPFAGATYISDDEDDSLEEELEELFDDEPRQPPSRSANLGRAITKPTPPSRRMEAPSSRNTPASRRISSSPPPAAAPAAGKPMLVRKRAPVDVFNRKPTKQRRMA